MLYDVLIQGIVGFVALQHKHDGVRVDCIQEFCFGILTTFANRSEYVKNTVDIFPLNLDISIP